MRRKMEDQQKQKEEAMKAAKEMQVIVQYGKLFFT